MYTIFCELTDGRECEVSKQEVSETTDTKLLQEWLEIFEEAREELRPDVKFYLEFGEVPQGLRHKYKLYSCAVYWIESRMRDLSRGPEAQRLVSEIENLKAAIKNRDIRIAHLEAIVRGEHS